jgi:hypothetical protein
VLARLAQTNPAWFREHDEWVKIGKLSEVLRVCKALGELSESLCARVAGEGSDTEVEVILRGAGNRPSELPDSFWGELAQRWTSLTPQTRALALPTLRAAAASRDGAAWPYIALALARDLPGGCPLSLVLLVELAQRNAVKQALAELSPMIRRLAGAGHFRVEFDPLLRAVGGR